MKRPNRSRPSTPLRILAVATSAWLVLGVLASPPAQARGFLKAAGRAVSHGWGGTKVAAGKATVAMGEAWGRWRTERSVMAAVRQQAVGAAKNPRIETDPAARAAMVTAAAEALHTGAGLSKKKATRMVTKLVDKGLREALKPAAGALVTAAKGLSAAKDLTGVTAGIAGLSAGFDAYATLALDRGDKADKNALRRSHKLEVRKTIVKVQDRLAALAEHATKTGDLALADAVLSAFENVGTKSERLACLLYTSRCV